MPAGPKALWHLQHTDNVYTQETRPIWARNGPTSAVKNQQYNYPKAHEKAHIRNFPFFDILIYTHSRQLYEHYTYKKTMKNPETLAAQRFPGTHEIE